MPTRSYSRSYSSLSSDSSSSSDSADSDSELAQRQMAATDCGYDERLFISVPHENLKCSICLCILKSPRQCVNGHIFCNICVTRALRTNKTCPICKVGMVFDFSCSRNLYVENVINDLLVRCPSRCSTDIISTSEDDACPWVGKLQASFYHFKNDCSNRLVPCTNPECKEWVQKKHLEVHENQYCAFRWIACEYCNQIFQVGEEHEHRLICPQHPIPCKNNCGVSVPRIMMEKHICLECPLHTVECPLFKLGVCHAHCTGKIMRWSIENHAAELPPVDPLTLLKNAFEQNS